MLENKITKFLESWKVRNEFTFLKGVSKYYTGQTEPTRGRIRFIITTLFPAAPAAPAAPFDLFDCAFLLHQLFQKHR